MFGSRRKKKINDNDRLKELVVLFGQHTSALVELTTQIKNIREDINDLRLKIKALELRQWRLRDRLKLAIIDPNDSNNEHS